MRMIRRYQKYKYLLQLVVMLNSLFLCFGMIALYRWLQNNDPTHAELVFVGLGVLFFGVALPMYSFNRISKKLLEIKKETEVLVIESVSKWLNTFEEFDDDEPLQNPKFWLNMGLILMEAIGDNARHPALQTLGELAPLLRKELKATSSSAVKSRKRKNQLAD